MPIARLNSRALIRIAGPDWRSFLQGLLSNDVETLAEGELRFAALLTPQGKFLFDLFVIGRSDGCLLDCAADRREALMLRLAMYRLRAKVEIEAEDGPIFAIWLEDQNLGGVPDPRYIGLGRRLYGEAEATASEDDYNDHRLGWGVPDPALDCVPDKTFPIEANFDLLNGIDFRKGCFIGQETTSRMKRRGAIKNRMLPFEVDGPLPPPGAEIIQSSGLRAGEVLSGRGDRAIALFRLDRLEEDFMTVDGHGVEYFWPNWMSRDRPFE